MATIKFSVHRNPKKDDLGRDTYQVRQDCSDTVDTKEMENGLKTRGVVRRETMETALTVLKDEIIDTLLDNKRLHLDGIGTFSLKIGFRERTDEEGKPMPVSFTDPKDITGNDLAVEGVIFQPDKAFMTSLKEKEAHFENATGRGRVGHSKEYTREALEADLSKYLTAHGRITCREMKREFGLTDYMSRKWLGILMSEPTPFLVEDKVGSTSFYSLA